MIVQCDTKGFIYVPLSKVANSSILTAIASSTGEPDLDNQRGRQLVDLEWHKISYSKLLSSKLFKFGFVRNPWDRIVSCYHDKIARWKDSIKTSPHFGVPTSMAFEEFVNWVANLVPNDHFYRDPHFIPQHIILVKDGTLCVDFIGRFERLIEDWRFISIKYGLRRLPHLNAQPRKHYSTYFNSHSRAIIDAHYRYDIELFNYHFEDQK